MKLRCLAPSLGDVVTLGLLAWISDVLYSDYLIGEFGGRAPIVIIRDHLIKVSQSPLQTLCSPEGYKAHIIIGGYFLMLPIFLALAYNNEHVSEVLRVSKQDVQMKSFNEKPDIASLR